MRHRLAHAHAYSDRIRGARQGEDDSNDDTLVTLARDPVVGMCSFALMPARNSICWTHVYALTAVKRSLHSCTKYPTMPLSSRVRRCCKAPIFKMEYFVGYAVT
eukprot:m.1073624 g.1073624  ORF g.1073624 m.1073624 type:complete len:104 (+) comp24235_c0_seq9:344-655(+)